VLSGVAIVGGIVLAGIGFTGSYKALAQLGVERNFGAFAYAFPIGLDAGIVVLLALDLFLIRRDTPWPVLRLLAHLLTVATIVFNASSGDEPIAADPIGAGMHAVIPIMFIASVEAGRRLIMKSADIEAGRDSQGVPAHRWALSPFRTWAMFRRMRLWDLASYADAVKREQALTVYRVMLERQYGSVRKAPSDARLPLTMAQYGLTVTEALELPQQAREDERLRKDAELAREVEAEERAAEREKARQISRIRTQGEIKAEQYAVDGKTEAAQAQAQAARIEAEAVAEAQARLAVQETAAMQSLTAAEAESRAAEAERLASEARADASEAERRALEADRAAAEEKARRAQLDRSAAEAARVASEARAAAAEAERRAAEVRAAAAVIELRAVEAEDAAKLSPRDRAVRKVARLILTTPSRDAEQLALEAIRDALAVSLSTASEYRREAAALIASGYRLP
jgi:hypothetical protein